MRAWPPESAQPRATPRGLGAQVLTPRGGLVAACVFRRWPRHALHVTNYRGAMHCYRERLYSPLSWWLVGMLSALTFGAVVWTGFDVAITIAIFAALILITA